MKLFWASEPPCARIARVVVRELRLKPRIEEIEGRGADAPPHLKKPRANRLLTIPGPGLGVS